jgi:UDP-N-acetylmuramate--alanine ligase
VIEADEYDYMFLGLKPEWAVITNVEYDHPDLFPTKESFQKAFRSFVERLSPGGTLFLCGEDPGAMELSDLLIEKQKMVVYGFQSPDRMYVARNVHLKSAGGVEFEILKQTEPDWDPIIISLQIPGNHNVLNGLAAFAVADQLGLDRTQISLALSLFQGSERRFDIRGEYQEIILVDDYAHHPTEIKATLSAARSAYPTRRIWAVWQPHTYTRTETLFSGFKEAFPSADRVIVLDVYPAREKKPEGFEMAALTQKIAHPDVVFLPEIEQVVHYLIGELSAGDLLLVFTAGNAIEINQKLEEELSHQ